MQGKRAGFRQVANFDRDFMVFGISRSAHEFIFHVEHVPLGKRHAARVGSVRLERARGNGQRQAALDAKQAHMELAVAICRNVEGAVKGAATVFAFGLRQLFNIEQHDAAFVGCGRKSLTVIARREHNLRAGDGCVGVACLVGNKEAHLCGRHHNKPMRARRFVSDGIGNILPTFYKQSTCSCRQHYQCSHSKFDEATP